MPQVARRFDFIDSVRGLAVILAMLSHSLGQFSPNFNGLDPFTRFATPAFVILFGIMIEIAYLKKFRRTGDQGAINHRLIARMITCYVMFVAISLAAFITGKLSIEGTIKAITFLGHGRFGVILKTYAVLFFLILLLLPALRRYGSTALLAVAAVAWALKITLDWVLPQSPYVLSFMFGNGKGFGPSILPSMLFLYFGLSIGEYLNGQRKLWPALLTVAIAFAVVCYDTTMIGLGQLREAWLAARWVNDPLYFAIGICTTSIFLTVFWLLWRRMSVDPLSRFLATIGQQTLFIYGGGNIALNLLPVYSGASPMISIIWILGFLAVLLTIAWLRAKQSGTLDRAFLRLPSAYSRVYDKCLATVVTPVQTLLEGRLIPKS